MTINPITSTSAFLSPICPPLNATLPKTYSPQSQSIPLAPLTGVSYTAIAPSSDRRAQRNRNRDPSWIPRPRNAFIIFRCEYSREHAQGSQESQNDHDHDSNNASVKTLSKRAAEAWKQLSPSEKDRYKVLADREREEHARLYPHYRFRPMKRQVSGTSKSSCERSQSPKSASVERLPAPLAHFPSVLATSPEKPRSNPPVERAEVSAPMPQVTGAPLPEPSSYPIDAWADVSTPRDKYRPRLTLYTSLRCHSGRTTIVLCHFSRRPTQLCRPTHHHLPLLLNCTLLSVRQQPAYPLIISAVTIPPLVLI